MSALKLAVLPDFAEERWPSMDLCAEMLVSHLPAAGVSPMVLRPRYRRLAGRLSGRGAARNLDRVLNRHLVYPRSLRGQSSHFDAFHVADHSYAQLVLSLPAERTGVHCFDLDAFKCLLRPDLDPRPRWFRALAGRSRRGLGRAALVFHNTHLLGRQLAETGLVRPERLRYAPLGIAPEFTAEVPPGVPPDWLPPGGPGPVLLHVGSSVPRKRIDDLLRVAAEVRRRGVPARLWKLGQALTPAQRQLASELHLTGAILERQNLTRTELAWAYHRADVVLLPSEAEGFGLPVIEALACGAAVVASDLLVTREAGGGAARYAPVGDTPAWADAVVAALDSTSDAERSARSAWAARFSWAGHARLTAGAYRELLR